ncbi:hypothetical protein QBC39DRAFT_379938 [Podospora conica]|nr:hypothetical protein QBC39DRAFT_379938 [Schizothecium conicum]
MTSIDPKRSPSASERSSTKRRLSETDLEDESGESGASGGCAKQQCRDPDSTESDLMDIDTDLAVPSDLEGLSEYERRQVEWWEEENGWEDEEEDETEEDIEGDFDNAQIARRNTSFNRNNLEEKQDDDALFEETLKEMTEAFESELETQPPPKPPKVKKTVRWAEKLVVILNEGDENVEMEDDSEEE